MNRAGYHCLFRLEAGPRIGLGHLSRCLALAQALEQSGQRCGFVMTSPDQEVRDRVLRKGFGLLERNGFLTPGSKEEALETAGQAARTAADWVVVDGYGFGPEYLAVLRRSTTASLLVIDDFQGAGEADLILNQNLAVDVDIYRGTKAELLLGPDYCLLPPGFEKGRPREYSGGVKRILVTAGGTDQSLLIADIVAALTEIPGLKVDVVLGPFNNDDYITSEYMGTIFNYHQSPPTLVPLIQKAELAIMTLGVTTWEMAALGLPFVMLPLHPAQLPTAQWLEDSDYADLGMGLGNFREGRFTETVRNLLNHPDLLERRSQRLRELVDGRGVARVAARMAQAGRAAA